MSKTKRLMALFCTMAMLFTSGIWTTSTFAEGEESASVSPGATETTQQDEPSEEEIAAKMAAEEAAKAEAERKAAEEAAKVEAEKKAAEEAAKAEAEKKAAEEAAKAEAEKKAAEEAAKAEADKKAAEEAAKAEAEKKAAEEAAKAEAEKKAAEEAAKAETEKKAAEEAAKAEAEKKAVEEANKAETELNAAENDDQSTESTPSTDKEIIVQEDFVPQDDVNADMAKKDADLEVDQAQTDGLQSAIEPTADNPVDIAENQEDKEPELEEKNEGAAKETKVDFLDGESKDFTLAAGDTLIITLKSSKAGLAVITLKMKDGTVPSFTFEGKEKTLKQENDLYVFEADVEDEKQNVIKLQAETMSVFTFSVDVADQPEIEIAELDTMVEDDDATEDEVKLPEEVADSQQLEIIEEERNNLNEKVTAVERSVSFYITCEDEEPDFGSVAHFVAVLEGYEGLEYQITWQNSVDEVEWVDTDAHGEIMDVIISEDNLELLWRVKVTLADNE